MDEKQRDELRKRYAEIGPRRSVPWQLLTGLVLGASAGVLLATPLIGWHLAEPSASLIGSALGAGAAVFGAFWLQRHEGNERRRALGDAMTAVLMRLDQILMDFVRKVEQEEKDGTSRDYGKEIAMLRALAEDVDRFAAQLFPSLGQLDYRSARIIDVQTFARLFIVDTELSETFRKQGTPMQRPAADMLKIARPLYLAVREAYDHFRKIAAAG